MNDNEIKVLIADDHALMRMGLRALLDTQRDIAVLGEATDGADALRKTARLRPDIVIMDIMMPGTDGIAATQQLSERHPDVRILVLTTSTSSDDLSRALKAGAAGAILKSEANAKLLAAIRAIARREQSVSPEVSAMIAKDPPADELSPRQQEILFALSRGLTNKEIATSLDCSPESVKDRINAICTKLGAANRTEAVAIALRKQLLKI